MNDGDLKDLFALFGHGRVSTKKTDRIAYARDLWPLEQIGVGESHNGVSREDFPFSYSPDAVFWPENVDEISCLLRFASERAIPVIPFGAGSGVCGGTVPVKGGIIVDLKRLDRIMEIDPQSQIVTVQAGIIGEILERRLNREGFTLGHFPSSIYCSTLGGWLATRSAGQLSTRYGKIEDIVLGLEVVLPDGKVFKTPVVPRSATGPDLKQLFIGSEGSLGIITQASLSLHRLPESRLFGGAMFSNVFQGLQAIKSILQAGTVPAVVRLYDELDTFLVGSRGKEVGEIPLPAGREKKEKGWSARWREEILRKGERFFLTHPRILNQVLSLAPHKCLLILVFEGEKDQVVWEEATARKMVELSEGKWVGPEPAENWWESRYAVSYQQSKVFANGAFVDTIEVVSTWSRLENLYKSIRQALSREALVMAHFSHAYLTGCSIYFTVVASASTPAEQKAVYQRIWQIALDNCVRAGGSISHHHGIGKLKGSWMSSEWGEVGMEILRKVKGILDPRGIMNPGTLGL